MHFPVTEGCSRFLRCRFTSEGPRDCLPRGHGSEKVPHFRQRGFFYHVPGGAVLGSRSWRALCQGGSMCHWPCEGRLSLHPVLRDHSWPLFMPVVSEKLGSFVFRLSAKVRRAPGPFF